MGGLNPFQKPKIPKPVIPKPAPLPPPVTVDTRAEDLRKAEEAELQRMKRQRGRAGTILLKDTSESATGGTAKTLLGG